MSFRKRVNHRRRNHVGNALGDIAAVTLKCDARLPSPFCITGPPLLPGLIWALIWIGKVLIDRRMGVELEIDSRDNPSGDRHSLAADRITVG